jgi:predicted nucleic acid-binding protein
MTVVSDTGPLIALATVEQLHLLERLWGVVKIPAAVHRELLAKIGPEAARLDEALATFIEVTPVAELAPEVQAATEGLGIGEQQAVALAYELKVLLVVDDRLARDAARRVGVTLTGVVGVLLRAKEVGLLPAVRPVLEDMRHRGYWLSDQLLDIATKVADET